jgi:hypothetical protein
MIETDINRLISAYIKDDIKKIGRLSGGHINQSYLIEGKDLYVLQSLNRTLFEKYTDFIVNNYERYRTACDIYKKKSGQWDYPIWLRDTEGEYLHRDSNGNIWRMYRYLRSDDPEVMRKRDHFKIGKGLGILHNILKNCKDVWNIPATEHLHDLSYHYNEYLKVDPEQDRINEIDDLIKENINRFLNIKVPAGGIIHGDSKVTNMIIREGKVEGFIDLDTIMNGSVYDDISDCARSCCVDDLGKTDTKAFEKLIQGYEEGFGTSFSNDEASLISENITKNRFMLGLRYYTDYLSGKGYFSEEYPGQTLKKACKLLLN